MGKTKKPHTARGDPYGRSGSLQTQIDESSSARPSNRQKRQRRLSADEILEPIDVRSTSKIMEVARKQREELEDEFFDDQETKSKSFHGKKIEPKLSATNFLAQFDVKSDDESEGEKSDEFSAENDLEPIDPEEEAQVEQFMPSNRHAVRTLGDVIREKISEKQIEQSAAFSDVTMQMRDLDPRLVDMYKGVGEVLSKYRSGKLPKAFKIIPKLANWEQILAITQPDQWTAAAMLQATRMFVSNLNAKMCQRFLNLVLLPRISDDIAEYKKLNVHLYMALRKSLFKPAAFFKGILLPMCESGTCSLREAVIISSVMSKCTIPVLHAAAAILKISEMEYNGANSVFLRTLIDKKYTLPFRVIDGLVNHFVRFASDKREMTVLWHQAFLAVVQRYKEDLSSEQKEALLDLLRVHFHHQIGHEIRRELMHAKCRDLEDALPATDNPDLL